LSSPCHQFFGHADARGVAEEGADELPVFVARVLLAVERDLLVFRLAVEEPFQRLGYFLGVAKVLDGIRVELRRWRERRNDGLLRLLTDGVAIFVGWLCHTFSFLNSFGQNLSGTILR
jgi:hypothetical protein